MNTKNSPCAPAELDAKRARRSFEKVRLSLEELAHYFLTSKKPASAFRSWLNTGCPFSFLSCRFGLFSVAHISLRLSVETGLGNGVGRSIFLKDIGKFQLNKPSRSVSDLL